MAATYTIARGSKVEFGTSNSLIPATFGVVTAATCDSQAQTVPVPNADGATVDLVFYDTTTSLSLTVIMKTDATLPVIGGSISVNNFNGLITGVTHNWTNNGLRQLNITATSPANLVAGA